MTPAAEAIANYVPKGERTRRAVLETAVDLASAEGLESLTIGRLAEALRLSKSGLFAHFGSKQDLQLATVEAARAIFIDRVVRPALTRERGIARLWGLCDEWLRYAEGEVFRGGCFFAAASAEVDSRPGPVRDRVATIMTEWLGALERAVREAQAAGELSSSADPTQLAFELNALAQGANWAHQLLADQSAFVRARTAMLTRLRGYAT